MTQLPVFDDSQSVEGFTLPPDDRYEWQIRGAEAKQGKAGWRISLLIEIMEGPHAGYQTFDNLMLQGKAAGMGAQKAAAFGLALLSGQHVEPRDFIGRRALGYGKAEKYGEYTNLKIDISRGTHCGYEPIGGPLTATDGNKEGLESIPF